ncbi:cache domain-containing protein [Salidesulfovibrio brasiliensis]|uniref:cache domain-containing protein n=1 Tax=Salidesulfovibrio brasiliensis TaxID=221711 RepID=UPI0009F91CED|nr:cache domain-containing protein [Salidesulfovibrio brasiliensis]
MAFPLCAYAAAPSGKEYIVSAGDYDLPMERCFVRNQVDQVADLVQSMGKEAFPLIRGRDGEYFWRDTYVFVMSPDGTELVNPAFPENEGRNMIEQNGPAKQYMPIVLKKKNVWVRYDWPKPGSDKPEPKRTYLRKVEYQGNVYIIGCGVYLSDE